MKNQITIALAALNAVAILLLLQINVGAIPLFPSTLSKDRAEKINALTSDLSQGILVSTFFYLLLVRLPEKQKARRVKTLIQPKLLIIANHIEISLHYLMHADGSRGTDLSRLERNSFDARSGLTGLPMNFKYEIEFSKGAWTPFSTGGVSDIAYFESERVLVERLVDEILSLPHVSDEDDDLVDLLPRLRDCFFYRCLKGYVQYANYNVRVSVPEFSGHLYEYWSLYRKLRKAAGTGPLIRIMHDPPK